MLYPAHRPPFTGRGLDTLPGPRIKVLCGRTFCKARLVSTLRPGGLRLSARRFAPCQHASAFKASLSAFQLFVFWGTATSDFLPGSIISRICVVQRTGRNSHPPPSCGVLGPVGRVGSLLRSFLDLGYLIRSEAVGLLVDGVRGFRARCIDQAEDLALLLVEPVLEGLRPCLSWA